MTIFWCTRYAFTKGVFKFEGKQSGEYASQIGTGLGHLFSVPWRLDAATPEEAAAQVEVKRARKRKALQKQISKLEKLVEIPE